MKVDFPDKISAIGPRRTYPPARACIYCGHDRVNLFPEHIIPYGIAGDSVILPEASCKKCGDMTGKFEGAILRNSWWPFRAQLNLPTRKPKDRPDTFTLRRIRMDGAKPALVESNQVPKTDFPRCLVMLRLRPPGIIEGRAATALIEGEFWMGYINSDVGKQASKDKEGFYAARFDTNSFCRMLAKIGHAFATAELGHGNFRPILTKFIKGKVSTPTYWVGGYPSIQAPVPGTLHQIDRRTQLVRGKPHVVVDIRLFSFFGTPKYTVVVGELF